MDDRRQLLADDSQDDVILSDDKSHQGQPKGDLENEQLQIEQEDSEPRQRADISATLSSLQPHEPSSSRSSSYLDPTHDQHETAPHRSHAPDGGHSLADNTYPALLKISLSQGSPSPVVPRKSEKSADPSVSADPRPTSHLRAATQRTTYGAVEAAPTSASVLGILKRVFSRFGSKSPDLRREEGGENHHSSGAETDPLHPTMEHAANGFYSKKKSPEDGEGDKTPDKPTFFVYYLACFATIGGLLFGYDTGIVSGSMLLIEKEFDLSTIWKELIVSGTVGAAAIFALFAGFTCDYLGRKITIMMASIVFIAGAIVMGAAQSKEMLLVGRIIVGIGIGFASMTVPVYVAEAAPPSIRGRLVTINQLFITIGILISSVVAGGFSSLEKTGWRYMLGLAGVPGVIQFIGFIYLPESPRWLVSKGKDDKARKVLQRIRGKEDVEDEMKEIQDALEESKKQSGFVLGRVVRTPHIRKALFVGCGLQVFQQLCGINTVIYYSATILRMAGFSAKLAIWLVLVPNGINFLSTIAGVALVERLGRKKLTVASFIGVVTALVVLAVGFQLSANFSPSINRNVTEFYGNYSEASDDCYRSTYSSCESCIESKHCGFCYEGSGDDGGSCVLANPDDEDLGADYGHCASNETHRPAGNATRNWSHGFCPTDYTWMAVLGLALFVMAFAPGLGPMPWTINSEIYPMWARSTCISIATGCNWICNLIVSLFFLTLTEAITKYGAFWLFGGICFIGLLFTIAFVPETKNRSLEEVEQLFMGNKKGKVNMGYEKDIAEPEHKTDTRL
ncbi:unnamed protein product [Lymnaea stagnalis]|uniref:Major facilitator superfamily (MFS) profile domain-containing protein n=1 Tax=Lymnaea stagnalis TaxID=6523 RepID=A0AAV2HSR2_LYMST